MALAQYGILDTVPEESFDRLVRLASHVLQTPAAYLNFVDGHRQWSKAAAGASPVETPLSESMCAWTITQDTPMVVEDTQQDPRFCDYPMVTGQPHIRMYAGAPLITPSGHRIGTLCVTDTRVHPLSDTDLQTLQDLAALVVTELELRAHNRVLSRDLKAANQHKADLRRTLEQAQTLEGITELTDLPLSSEEMTLSAAALLSDAIASDLTGLLVFEGNTLRVQAAHSHPRLSQAQRQVFDHLPRAPQGVLGAVRESALPMYLNDYASHPRALPEMLAAGVKQMACVPLGTREGVTSVLMAIRLQDHPVGQWRGSDIDLLEAAGRTLRAGLERRQVTDRARREARQDTLTGVLNRRAFEEDLVAWQTRAYNLALIDLDGLKGINDQEGHAQGDRLLQVFAGALEHELPYGAGLYRIGGDEFVVLLDSRDGERLNELVDTALLAARQVVAGTVGASMGVADSREATRGTLLELADKRMYSIKQRRKAQAAPDSLPSSES